MHVYRQRIYRLELETEETRFETSNLTTLNVSGWEQKVCNKNQINVVIFILKHYSHFTVSKGTEKNVLSNYLCILNPFASSGLWISQGVWGVIYLLLRKRSNSTTACYPYPFPSCIIIVRTDSGVTVVTCCNFPDFKKYKLELRWGQP